MELCNFNLIYDIFLPKQKYLHQISLFFGKLGSYYTKGKLRNRVRPKPIKKMLERA